MTPEQARELAAVVEQLAVAVALQGEAKRCRFCLAWREPTGDWGYGVEDHLDECPVARIGKLSDALGGD